MADRDAVPRALLAVLLGVFNKMPGMAEAAKTVRTSIKRRFYACVSGSLHQLGTGGSDGACWSTQNGKMPEILGTHMEGCDAQSSVSILSQAVLKEARILEYANTLPCAVGVHISCVPNQEVTRTGVGYAFTALPESTNNNSLVVYENDATTAESMAWRAQYPEYNSLNLETQGVLNVQGESFVFVSKAHPVIDLLRANKDVLKADIDKQTLIDDQWLKVTKQVMSTCCGQIKSKVLNKVGTVDLSNITMQICRIDAPWKQMSENDPLFAKIPQHLTTAPDPPADESMRAKWDEEQTARQAQFTAECSKLFKKPMAFHCRFELTFDLLPISI